MMESRFLCLGAAALALSACGLGGKAPGLLLNLTSDATMPAQNANSSSAENAVTVVRPSVPNALATTRVPVLSGQSVTYLKDAYWVDTPDKLFQNLLSETIGARTGRVVLDPLQTSLNPGNRLTGQLRNFGVDAQRMEAVVTYDAALAPNKAAVTVRRFEARVPVASIDRDTAASALNQAANQVAAQVADWLGK